MALPDRQRCIRSEQLVAEDLGEEDEGGEGELLGVSLSRSSSVSCHTSVSLAVSKSIVSFIRPFLSF